MTLNDAASFVFVRWCYSKCEISLCGLIAPGGSGADSECEIRKGRFAIMAMTASFRTIGSSKTKIAENQEFRGTYSVAHREIFPVDQKELVFDGEKPFIRGVNIAIQAASSFFGIEVILHYRHSSLRIFVSNINHAWLIVASLA